MGGKKWTKKKRKKGSTYSFYGQVERNENQEEENYQRGRH